MLQKRILHFAEALGRCKHRDSAAHKGDFGRLLIIGGAPGMSGAPRLAGEAALRVGAGLVRIATHPDHAAVANAMYPELMVKGVNGIGDMQSWIEDATHIVLGPGLGQEAWGQNLFNALIDVDKPLLVDADGLNLLARAHSRSSKWVLTPHPGEAARLLQVDVAQIQRDRDAAVRGLHQLYGGVIVLKGRQTLVYAGGDDVWLCKQGNPGMATAGMGDVLSGVIAGLWPQCDGALSAAQLGVILHAMAGDCAAQEGQRGLIASDLFKHLQKLLN